MEGRWPRGGDLGWAKWGRGEQVRGALGETDSGLLQRGALGGLPPWTYHSGEGSLGAAFTLTFHGPPHGPLLQQALSAG